MCGDFANNAEDCSKSSQSQVRRGCEKTAGMFPYLVSCVGSLMTGILVVQKCWIIEGRFKHRDFLCLPCRIGILEFEPEIWKPNNSPI